MTDKCVHHWYYPTSEGVTSTGTCTKCGATREDKNYMDLALDNQLSIPYHREQ